MLPMLQKLFAAKKQVEPAPVNGKVTLADVLRLDWFDLWYQPKIDLRGRYLVGAEALVRARRPDGSMLSPAAFLPGAAEADMLALTERVILTALRDFEDYAAQGVSLKLSVNVPASAFIKLPIAKMLREERPAAETWPGLILEVTEDEVMHDLAIAQEVADELRALNCSLALDDFGAGYSSLARLRQLPFSELKIDRSYVTNCHADKVNGGLCETIVELAKRFALKTVAEGIEFDARGPQAAGHRLRHRPGLSVRQANVEGSFRQHAGPPHGRSQAGRQAAPRCRRVAARSVRRDVRRIARCIGRTCSGNPRLSSQSLSRGGPRQARA